MDTLFFWLSKLFWPVFSPGSLLVWLVLAAWLLSLSRRESLGRALLGAAALFTVVIAWVPVGVQLAHPLEQRFATPAEITEAPQGIVVLGGSFSLRVSEDRQLPQLTGNAERLVAFLELARRFPQARLVFTGGSGSPLFQEAREADLARDLFTAMGLTGERLLFERESRNTYENALNTAALVEPDPGENWLLITSALHMPRAMGSFCAQGWKMTPYPVDYQTLADAPWLLRLNFVGHLLSLESALREWVGLIAYRLTGKTNRLLPGPNDNC